MKINFTLHVEDADPDLFQSLSAAFSGAPLNKKTPDKSSKKKLKAGKGAVAAGPETPSEEAPEAEAPETEASEAEAEAPEDEALPKDPVGKEGTPAALQKSMEAIGRPTTASLKLADDTRAKPGDYVMYKGEVMVLSIAYRGRGLLENEEGRGFLAEAKNITPAKGRQVPEQQHEGVAEAEPVEAPVETPKAKANGETTFTPEEVKELYIRVSKTVSPTRANELMRKLAGGKRLGELTKVELAEASKVLLGELEKFEASA